MVTPELMAQVKMQLSSGMSRANIEQTLRVAGFDEADIANVFTLIEMAKSNTTQEQKTIDPSALVAPIDKTVSESSPAPLVSPIAPLPVSVPPSPVVPSPQIAVVSMQHATEAPPMAKPMTAFVSSTNASASAIPKSIVPPTPPVNNVRAQMQNMRTSTAETVLEKRGTSHLGLWISVLLFIAVLGVIGGLIAVEKLYPDVYKTVLQDQYSVPPLYETAQAYLAPYVPMLAAQQKNDYDALYAKYCAAAPPLSEIRVPLDVATSTYAQISDAIASAKAEKSPEKLALLYDELTMLAQAEDTSANPLGRDALQAKSGDAFSAKFSLIAQELSVLFAAFEKAGLTPEKWSESVKIDVQDHRVTDEEYILFAAWYEKSKNPAFIKLPAAQKGKATTAYLAYLAEIHTLLRDTNDARMEVARENDPIQSILSAKEETAALALTEGSPTDGVAGFKVALLGQAILKESKDFDEALRFQKCAAEKYYDAHSMYMLAAYYARGVNTAVSPELAIEKPIEKDLKVAYFWNMALVLVDSLQYGLYSSSDGTASQNTISAIEGIQNASGIPKEELLAIEESAHAFVATKYPDVMMSGFEISVGRPTESPQSTASSTETGMSAKKVQ